MKIRRGMPAAAALLCMFLVKPSAQQAATGQVHGHVSDAVKASIARANVFLHAYASTGDKIDLVTHTDEKGDFVLSLPEGAYDLIVTSPGFGSTLRTIVVHARKKSEVDVTLKAEPCDFPGVNCDTFQ